MNLAIDPSSIRFQGNVWIMPSLSNVLELQASLDQRETLLKGLFILSPKVVNGVVYLRFLWSDETSPRYAKPIQDEIRKHNGKHCTNKKREFTLLRDAHQEWLVEYVETLDLIKLN